MLAQTFTTGHYLLATHGLALIRTWALDDSGASTRFIQELSNVVNQLDSAPYAEQLTVQEATVATGYGAWAPVYDAENAQNPLVVLEAAILDNVLPGVSGKRVLDVACGTGRQEARLKALGFDAVGLDATEGMLTVARKNHPDVEYVKGDFREMPFADAEFDAVLCTLAITHVAELDRVIAELARVVRRGGRVVIVDVHPMQVLLGAHVTVSATGTHHAVRNHAHWPSRYLAEFKANSLEVVECFEPTYDEETADLLPAALHFPEANRAAFVGTPALLAWDLVKTDEGAQ